MPLYINTSYINDSDIPGEIALFLFMASKNGSVKIAITSVKRVKNSFSLIWVCGSRDSPVLGQETIIAR